MEKGVERSEKVLKPDNALFVPVYHTFLESDVLDGKEKIVFIILKKFLKIGTGQGQVYPKLETICKYTGMTKNTVRKIIKSLQKKGVLEIRQRGATKTNLYTLKDFPEMWETVDVEGSKTIIDGIDEKQGIEQPTSKGFCTSKEKGLDTEPTKEQDQAPNDLHNISSRKDTINEPKSQAERYPGDYRGQ